MIIDNEILNFSIINAVQYQIYFNKKLIMHNNKQQQCKTVKITIISNLLHSPYNNSHSNSKLITYFFGTSKKG